MAPGDCRLSMTTTLALRAHQASLASSRKSAPRSSIRRVVVDRLDRLLLALCIEFGCHPIACPPCRICRSCLTLAAKRVGVAHHSQRPVDRACQPITTNNGLGCTAETSTGTMCSREQTRSSVRNKSHGWRSGLPGFTQRPYANRTHGRFRGRAFARARETKEAAWSGRRHARDPLRIIRHVRIAWWCCCRQPCLVHMSA